MKISDLDQPRVGDIVEFETDPDTVVEGVIVGETEDGYIYEFSDTGYAVLDEACWPGYHKDGMKTMFGKEYPNCKKNKNESLETYIRKGECPGCGGAMVAESQLNEKQDACYHKVKSRYKVWPSAYASGALVQCRKKGAANWGDASESITQEEYDQLDENLKKWFSDKWVRFGPDGKIKGDCARGDDSEGKPKCLPQSKAHAMGKEGRASAGARKRRQDPDADRSGAAINVATKKKSNENVLEAQYQGREVPLGRPMQGDVKKFKVYVKDPGTGNVKKVNFGDPNMRIKKSNPARRRSFRARHNCKTPGPRTKARYWSCRKW